MNQHQQGHLLIVSTFEEEVSKSNKTLNDSMDVLKSLHKSIKQSKQFNKTSREFISKLRSSLYK